MGEKKLINMIFHLIKAPQKFVWKIQFNERAPPNSRRRGGGLRYFSISNHLHGCISESTTTAECNKNWGINPHGKQTLPTDISAMMMMMMVEHK